MRITIVGGGNIGTQFATHCAEKGHSVTVYTSTPYLYNGTLSIIDEKGKVTHQGEIVNATFDSEEAFRFAELIIVTLPASLMNHIADEIFEHTSEKTMIGVVPGNGGSECAFKKCIERGNVFFGLERVPAIARLVQKGSIVRSIGYRDELHIAALPSSKAKECAGIIESIFGIKSTTIPCFLNLTMTPSNPILHTSRLYTLFSDWHEGMDYESIPLFYEEWDDASSQLLFKCDDEVQAICRSIPELNLKYVRSLRDHYESSTIKEMTNKISSIPAFKGIKTPMIKKGEGFIPDLHSRYFTADFSFGLTIIKQVAGFAGVRTPVIDELMSWYLGIAVEKQQFRFSDYGITDKEKLLDFYTL